MAIGKFEDLESVINDPKYKTILVASHTVPDSDALFSVKYFTDMINNIKGKKAIGVVGKDASSDALAYWDHFKPELQKAEEDLGKKPDLLLLVDCQYNPTRIAIPPDVNAEELDKVCLDAHSPPKDEKSIKQYKACLIDDSVRATASLIVRETQKEKIESLDQDTSTLGKLAIWTDTRSMTESTKGDRYASYVITKNADEGLVSKFLAVTLSREGYRALNEAQLSSEVVGSCEFAYIKNLKPRDNLAIAVAAESFLGFSDSKPIVMTAGFISGEKPDENHIHLSLRDGRPVLERRAGEMIREMFGDLVAGGDPYKAGAKLDVPFFERCIYNKSFSDLMKTNLVRILQKSDMGREFNEDSIDSTKQVKDIESKGETLKEYLYTKNLSKGGLEISTRARMNYHERGKFTTAYVNFVSEDNFSSAIKQEDIQGLVNAHDGLMKLENTDGSIVYGVVQSVSSAYILALIADKGKNNYMEINELAKTLFGEKLYDGAEKVKVGEVDCNRVIVKFDLPKFLRLSYKDPLLSRTVYEEVESKLDTVLGDSDTYKAWKGQYIIKP